MCAAPGPHTSAGRGSARVVRSWTIVPHWIGANTFIPAWMPAPWGRHPIAGYIVAVLLEGLAVAMTQALRVAVPTFIFRTALPLLVIALIALSWGAGPAIVATLVGVGLLQYVTLLPQPTPGPHQRIDLTSDGLLTLVGLSLVVVSSRTERIRREAQAARAAAVAALQAQDEFLSVAAHELKTPMTSAKVAAELLLQRYAQYTTPDPVQMQQALRTIDLQIDKLSQRVIELLETVRLHAGRFTLDPTRTDVTALVSDIADQAQARTARHELVVSAEERISAVVDAPRLEQVVTNLLDNAIQFSPGGGRIEIGLTRPTPDTVRLTVRDYGLGVPPEHRPHLFERFYQAHAQSHRSGLGLGLYISREIVERHGGEIRAEFPSDGGTRFVLTLPSGLGAAARSLVETWR